MPPDSVPDVLHFVQPPFHTNGHSTSTHIPVITVPGPGVAKVHFLAK